MVVRLERPASQEQPARSWITGPQVQRLIEAGLLREGLAGGAAFKVDRVALRHLIDELNLLADAEEAADPCATQAGPPAVTDTWQNGPKLIVVKGATEGTIFPLQGNGRSSWLVGRGPEADVSLPHDPYVSRHGAEVYMEGNDYFIEDRAPGKNGIFLNWRRLDRREAAHLEEGDIVGIGRSLLVFRET